MAKKKKRQYDRSKVLRKINREEQLEHPHGKSGIHCDKRERRKNKMTTQDYIDEAEDDTISHSDWMDGGPGEKLWDGEEQENGEDKENSNTD